MALSLTESRRRILLNTPHIEAVSGDIATFSTDMAAPLKSCVVAINPVQAGTGDPSPDNVRPISGWSAVNVWRTGKNLWDDDFTPQIIEVYSVNGNKDTAYGKELHLPTGTYVFSFNGSPAAYIFGNVLNADGTWKSTFKLTTSTARVHTITLANGEYANLYRASGKLTELTSGKIQIELGYTATSYAPYSGNQYTIQLGQTVYGGTLDVTNGVLTDYSYFRTFDGTEGWTTVGSGSGRYAALIVTNENIIYGGSEYYSCSHLPIAQPATTNDTVGAFAYYATSYHETRLVARLPSSFGATTGTAFKQFLAEQYAAGTPYQFYFRLIDSKSTVYQLTPQQIQTLVGANNIWADCGPVDIKYWTH